MGDSQRRRFTAHRKKKVRAENNESRVTAVRQEKSEVGTRFDQRRVMI